jgi:hypothetical protein
MMTKPNFLAFRHGLCTSIMMICESFATMPTRYLRAAQAPSHTAAQGDSTAAVLLP